MLAIAALGCGILLGFACAGRLARLYWRCLATWPLPRGRATRRLLRVHTSLLTRAGHHPYVIACLAALAEAPDAAARAAAQARLRWYCAVRVRSSL